MFCIHLGMDIALTVLILLNAPDRDIMAPNGSPFINEVTALRPLSTGPSQAAAGNITGNAIIKICPKGLLKTFLTILKALPNTFPIPPITPPIALPIPPTNPPIILPIPPKMNDPPAKP